MSLPPSHLFAQFTHSFLRQNISEFQVSRHWRDLSAIRIALGEQYLTIAIRVDAPNPCCDYLSFSKRPHPSFYAFKITARVDHLPLPYPLHSSSLRSQFCSAFCLSGYFELLESHNDLRRGFHRSISDQIEKSCSGYIFFGSLRIARIYICLSSGENLRLILRFSTFYTRCIPVHTYVYAGLSLKIFVCFPSTMSRVISEAVMASLAIVRIPGVLNLH